MRCRPGNLCVVLYAPATGILDEVCRRIVGSFCTVKFLRPPTVDTCNSGLVWEIEPEIRVDIGDRTFIVTGMADDALQPIRGQRENIATEQRASA